MSKSKNIPHAQVDACLCGSLKAYAQCCLPYIQGDCVAPDAEALMRSRYVAYVLRNEAYLLKTWYAKTRPDYVLDEDSMHVKWLGLRVLAYQQEGADSASVEFIARYKYMGRACSLHEKSRFFYETGQWFYVDGTFPASS